jgi:alanyl-tRNA synthetase
LPLATAAAAAAIAANTTAAATARAPHRRSLVAPNHTMTHVLNFALRSVLCGGLDNKAVAQGLCDQKGSFVDDDKLRFDFAWTGPLQAAQIAAVEAIVNETIQVIVPP